ncbi:MAG TPA: 3-hydroxyacyl-CoA dehydrogenase family protein [Nitrososphaeraceae archaeon]|nr:3-hydroxyacyl-CoA dehydrogenase family protein [Nitrososphaeraceae archaeon]
MSSINKVTVLGSGVMGHGIAQIAAIAGYDVALRDIEKSFLDRAMDKIKWSLAKMVEKKKLTQTDADRVFSRIIPMTDLQQALKDTDLLIEAVPEEMDLKKKVYHELNKYAESKTVYASNTSTLPITEMAALTDRPERFVGVHFFNPPQLMQLVEVIPGGKTDQSIIDLAINFILHIGKQPVLCRKDVAGFIVNRIFIPLVHEAIYCKDRDGASMTQIDSAVKFKMAFPMGIFELADFTGIDIIHKATTEMYLRDKKVVNPHPMIKKLFEEGDLGQKSGKGFYEYKGNGYERINLTEEQAQTYDPIKLVAVAANHAAWIISNGVCDMQDLELSLKLGMGLKLGLFRTIDNFGIENIIKSLEDLQQSYGSFYEPEKYLLKYKSQ